MKTAYVTMFSVISATVLVASPARAQPPQPVSADYGTFGASDDGDLNHPSFGVMSDGEEYLFDVVTSAKFCAKDSGFVCVWGSIFNLAVPRRALKADESWRFGGFEFHVLPHRDHDYPPTLDAKAGSAEREVRLLGDAIQYYAISAKRSDSADACPAVYLFSPLRGLIGVIYPPCQGRAATFNYLAEHDGPGSMTFDSKIPARVFFSAKELAALAAPAAPK